MYLQTRLLFAFMNEKHLLVHWLKIQHETEANFGVAFVKKLANRDWRRETRQGQKCRRDN